jgi:hypothetical protein
MWQDTASQYHACVRSEAFASGTTWQWLVKVLKSLRLECELVYRCEEKAHQIADLFVPGVGYIVSGGKLNLASPQSQIGRNPGALLVAG